MKAAVLEKIDAPLAVREVGLTELGIGQVLVQVLVSGLCGAQLHEIRGHKGNAKFLPHLMGHEGCGIVGIWILWRATASTPHAFTHAYPQNTNYG